jgi:hypothetical protein
MSCIEGVELLHKAPPSTPAGPPRLVWVAQLIGDSSETVALSRFRQVQGKLRNVLGKYEPTVVRTTIKANAAPIWLRVRIEFEARREAETLCSKLETAGEPCLVQRGFDETAIFRKTGTGQSN